MTETSREAAEQPQDYASLRRYAKRAIFSGIKAELIARLQGLPAPDPKPRPAKRPREVKEGEDGPSTKKVKKDAAKIATNTPNASTNANMPIVSAEGGDSAVILIHQLVAPQASTSTLDLPVSAIAQVADVDEVSLIATKTLKATKSSKPVEKAAPKKTTTKKATSTKKTPPIAAALTRPAPKPLTLIRTRPVVLNADAQNAVIQSVSGSPQLRADIYNLPQPIPSLKTKKSISGPVVKQVAAFKLTRVAPLTAPQPSINAVTADVAESLDWVPDFLHKIHNSLAARHPQLQIPTLEIPRTEDLTILKLLYRFYVHRYAVLFASFDVGMLDLAQAAANVKSLESLSSDVASVTFDNDQKAFVVASTGECIGLQAAVDGPDQNLRSDWVNLLQDDQIDLLSQVRSDEDYPQGISKRFSQFQSGNLLQYAKSFILAHVAPRSISGTYQSAIDQRNESAGKAATDAKPPPNIKAVLYLAQKYSVESVICPTKMHQALCEVQTPTQMYFVLRLTGQIIGDEEEGIPDVWQDMFNCDARGLVK